MTLSSMQANITDRVLSRVPELGSRYFKSAKRPKIVAIRLSLRTIGNCIPTKDIQRFNPGFEFRNERRGRQTHKTDQAGNLTAWGSSQAYFQREPHGLP